MVELKEAKDLWLSRFSEVEGSLRKNGTEWLADLRRNAIGRYERIGFPARHEEWKYTSLAPLRKIAFQRPSPGKLPSREAIEAWNLGAAGGPEGLAGSRLVVVDGRFTPALSSLGDLPRGVSIGSLAEAIASRPDVVRAHLSRQLDYYEDHQPFVALNDAFFEDGVFIHVESGAALELPLHVLFVTTERPEPTATHPRILAIVEDGGRLSLVEDYVQLGEATVLTNPVTELAIGKKAAVDHYRLLREGEQAFHMSALGVRQDSSSEFASQAICLGGGLVRNDVHAVLDGDHARCTLNGLLVGTGRQHTDNHTRIVHAKPDSKSWEVYKAILDGSATGVFNGKIYVDQIAQKTDAKQTNKTILLSADAMMNSKPELEIYADDVKCTHGATVGYLDKEALFYLRTRGIPEEAARNILTYAFTNDIVDQIRVAPLRKTVEELLLRKLPQGAQ